MVCEFVPLDERASEKTKLHIVKQSGSMDDYISVFRELVELCGV